MSAYAFSNTYKEWFVKSFGLESKNLGDINEEVVNSDVKMTAVSYHMIDSTVVLLTTFEKTDGEVFSDELQITEIALKEKGKNITFDLIGIDTEISDDKHILMGVITFHLKETYVGKQLELEISDIYNYNSETMQIPGTWNVPVCFNENTENYKQIINVNPIEVAIDNKRYTISDVAVADTVIIFRTANIENSYDEKNVLSSQYGARVTIEYQDGTKQEEMYCIPGTDGELIAWSWESLNAKEIKQIYLEGKEVINGQ